ncbi:methylenetetrahydrofolate reductase 1 [Lecanora helva]
MQKITDKIAALPTGFNYFSLEFFPPRTQTGFSNLQSRLERMSSALRPLFVNVTWGAGGSTSSRSLELAEICQRQLGLTTCLHLTCTNMKRKIVDDALEEAKALGVRNILALRGDPPRDEEYRLEDEDVGGEEDSNSDFTWAIDLVRYIRKVHKDYFCIGVAGYPEGHADQSHPTDQSPLHDLPYLIDKTKAGADFIMTQLFYDLDAYTKYEKMLREHESGVFATIPIIPGLMPLQSYDILIRTTKLAHAKVPEELLHRLQRVKGDDEAVKQVGVEAMSEIIDGIREVKQKGPRGFHFYTLNLEKAVSSLLERCDLIPPDPNDSAIEEDPLLTNGHTTRDRTVSSTSSSAVAQLTLDSHRSSSASRPLIPLPNSNPLSREMTWDDYPNGRFGDARSPAFNPPLTYSPTSLTVSPAQALNLWGTPTTNVEITQLFKSHLSGSSPKQLPWSESATLSPETKLITKELTALTQEKGYWTIASQPAIDGLPSTHAIHGWGPPGGFVFQKAFVEFFILTPTFTANLLPHLDTLHKQGEISYYAGNSRGQFLSSETKDAVHAVTWGSFAGKEIATATMVEEVSFRAWVEEAFGIWGEWARCVGEAGKRGEDGRARESRGFLRGLSGEVWLVNVIGHGYRERGRLWEILMQG